MASSTCYITASSCEDIIKDQYWLTSTYILFAMPYFVYEIYAMVMSYWYKQRVKDHKADSGFLIVLQHVVMVTVCFPISVFWRQGKGDYFQGVMLRAELSTPSVCLGKILNHYKQQHTPLDKHTAIMALLKS
uniref:TLC domain-containing protein n=1 Tax=Oncorhynchus tshawytscha TaxID=74940 RepID=A0A8C8DFN5_ONCTS